MSSKEKGAPTHPSKTKNTTFINEYYTTSGINKIPIKRAEVLKNEELFQLYKKPKKDAKKEIAHMNGIEPKAILQADLLYLPDDKGYKYALVCVDVGSGYTDAEPVLNDGLYCFDVRENST